MRGPRSSPNWGFDRLPRKCSRWPVRFAERPRFGSPWGLPHDGPGRLMGPDKAKFARYLRDACPHRTRQGQICSLFTVLARIPGQRGRLDSITRGQICSLFTVLARIPGYWGRPDKSRQGQICSLFTVLARISDQRATLDRARQVQS